MNPHDKLYRDIIDLAELRLMGAEGLPVIALAASSKIVGVPGNNSVDYEWFATARIGDRDSGFGGTGATPSEALTSLRQGLLDAHAAVDLRRELTLADIVGRPPVLEREYTRASA
jgi:hypothetical protein